jgi:hypothetical protein
MPAAKKIRRRLNPDQLESVRWPRLSVAVHRLLEALKAGAGHA